MNKPFSKINWSAIREYLMIALGLVMYATAWKAFLLPHRITGGGATGVSAIVQYGTGVPVAVTYAIINGVLLIFSL